MKIIIAADGSCVVVEPRDFGAFSVEVPSAVNSESIGPSLGELGTFDGSHVWVRVERLRNLLHLGPDDETSFDKMVEYATQHGWTNGDASALRSHVDRT